MSAPQGMGRVRVVGCSPVHTPQRIRLEAGCPFSVYAHKSIHPRQCPGGNVTVRFLTSAVVFSLLIATTVADAAEGLLITQRMTSGGPPLTIQVQIEATRMRTDMVGPNGALQAMIFDGGKQVLYIVDPARKTYMEMTKADADRMGAQVQGAMAQMQAQLEKLPPAQRAQMEAMMKGRGGAAAVPQYTRTGTDTVGRWTCDKYDVMQDGQRIGEVCSVNPTTLGFGAADFQVMG